MKIGLVTPSWPGDESANGITTAVVHLAAGLESIGQDVTVVSLTPCNAPDPRVVNLPKERPKSLFEKLSAKFGRDIAFLPIMVERIVGAAEEAIRERGIEVLIMEESFGWAGPVQRRLPIPVVVTLHGPWLVHQEFHKNDRMLTQNTHREAAERAAITACAGITAPSEDVLERVRAAYGLTGIPKAVIPNSIPPSEALDYSSLDEVARNGLLFVGRYDLHKGGDTVLDAFGQLIQSCTDAHLTFCGPDSGLGGPDGRHQQIADGLAALPQEAQARITYKGLCSKAEISRLRQRHAVAIIASRYENFPYTVLESLSAGVATVATAVGGIPEIIRDTETGLLVPPNSPADLAAACRRLLKEARLCKKLGTAARADIAERFAPDQIARQTTRFLKHVLAESRR